MYFVEKKSLVNQTAESEVVDLTGDGDEMVDLRAEEDDDLYIVAECWRNFGLHPHFLAADSA